MEVAGRAASFDLRTEKRTRVLQCYAFHVIGGTPGDENFHEEEQRVHPQFLEESRVQRSCDRLVNGA